MKYLPEIGRYVLLMRHLFDRPDNWMMFRRELFRQMNNIGIGSLIIISIISIFVGAVTAIQFAYQMEGQLFPMYLLGYIIRDSMVIELAPTLSALILAGKVGSNLSSELGTMRISEQIDALEIMGINTANYLIAPKVWASVLIVPALVVVSAFLGIYGGYLAAANYGIAPAIYEKGLLSWFKEFNLVIMIIKSIVFPFLITTIACYEGYFVKGGAIEIGQASTRAVVHGSIMVILFDYIITSLVT